MSEKIKFGEVCGHGSLKRKCEICERDEEIAALKSLLAGCEAELRTISQEPCTQEKVCCLCCVHCIAEEALAKIAAWRKGE